MFDWLKKRAKGVAAQVNPFDGGKTYSTVVNNRQPTPRPTNSPVQVVNRPRTQTPSAVSIPRKDPFNSSLNNFGSVNVEQTVRQPQLQAKGVEEAKTLSQRKPVPKKQPKVTAALMVQANRGQGVLRPEVLKQQQREAVREHLGRQNWQNKTNIQRATAAATVPLRSVMRVTTGIGQGASGLVDWASPGHGQSRVTQKLNRMAEKIDADADRHGVGRGYRATNVPLEMASYVIPSTAASKAPKLMDRGRRIADVTAKTVRGGSDKFVRRSGEAITRELLDPRNMASELAVFGKQTGEQAARGEAITPADLAINAGMAIPGAALGAGINRVAPHVFRRVRGMRSTPLNEAGNIQVPDTIGGQLERVSNRGKLNRSKIHPDDQAIMSDLIDYSRGQYHPDRATALRLQEDAARIAEHYELDMPPTLNGLADSFDDVLSRNRFGMKRMNEGGYIRLGSPEPKKLPQEVKDQFSKQGGFGRDALDRLEANKISKGDLERAGIVFDPKQIKKIGQTLPEFKDNPVMTYRKGEYNYMAGNGRYRSTPDKATSGTFEFKHKNGTMRLNPEALLGKDMAQKLAQTAKDGELVDFSDTMKATGNRLYTYKQTPDTPKAMSIDPLESLKAEARKYKSAEEFVSKEWYGQMEKNIAKKATDSPYASVRKYADNWTKGGKTINPNDFQRLLDKDVFPDAKSIRRATEADAIDGVYSPQSRIIELKDGTKILTDVSPSGSKLLLTEFAVEGKSRNKGIGTAYVNKLKEIADDMGVDIEVGRITATADPFWRKTLDPTGSSEYTTIRKYKAKDNASQTKQQLTDIYNQATAPKTGEVAPQPTKGATPKPFDTLKSEGWKTASNKEVFTNSADGKTQVKIRQMQDGSYKVAWTTKFDTPLGGNSTGNSKVFNSFDEALTEARNRAEISKPQTTNTSQISKVENTNPAIKDVEATMNPQALQQRGGAVTSIEPSARGGEYWNIKFADGSEVMNTKIPKPAPQPAKAMSVNDRTQKVAQHAKSKARKAYEATGSVAEAKRAHNEVIDRARKLASTRQRQAVSSRVQADAPVRNPSQSQSASSSQLPGENLGQASSRAAGRPLTREAAPVSKTLRVQEPGYGTQTKTSSGRSSDNTINLKTIDVNDPFKNQSLRQRFRNEFGKYFVDEDAEMINLFKRIEKETGGKDLVEKWLQDTDLVRASNSIANSKIRNNTNLSKAINGLKKRELAELDRYAAARSELSNLQRGLTSTSKSATELEQAVKNLGGKYGKRFEALNSYYNDLANDLYDAGIISKTKRDTWAKNKDYVRVQRDMEDLLEPSVGRGRSRSFGSTSTSKKRTGSQRDILSSTETALKRTQEIQLEVQRNKAASNTIDALNKYGLAQKVPTTQAAGKNVIKRFKDGKVEYFATSKDIKRVIDNVNPVQLGVIARVISAPTRLFRAGTTALSAPFAVTNLMRDQASSAIYSKRVWATHNPKNIVAGIHGAIKDYGGVQNDPLWKKFEQIAGDQTIFDELRNAKNSKKMINEVRRGGGAKARAIELTNPLNVVRNMEDLIGITEKSTRFQNFKGIYEKSLKDGLGEEVAIRRATQAALQNSVNFSRAGQITRVANLMLPYFNAGIQGSRNVGRSLRDRPVSTIAKSAAFVGIPAIGAVLYNYADPESRRIYENISDTEKENNFIFVLPGAKQNEAGVYEGIIKIPKTHGYKELTDPLRIVAETFAGSENEKSIAEMLKDMTQSMTGPVQITDANKFMSTFVPQVAKPILQAHFNKDLYWGTDTVPDYMVDGTEDPTKRAYKNTSGMARFIANQLGVSPIQVEKAIVDASGSVGRYGINAADSVLAKAGAIPKEQVGGRSVTDDFSRRMFEVRGVDRDNPTSGQRYFKAIRDATEGLGKQQRTAWDSYNQSNKNFLGEELYGKSGFAKRQAKAAAYVQFPELFKIDKEIDKKTRTKGEPGNPLYDLTYTQALKVVHKKALPPGSKDKELDGLYQHEWYSDFKAKETEFYDKIFKGKQSTNDNPYPERSTALQQKMDYYYTLPSGTGARSAFIRANPDITAHWDQVESWTNRERNKIGLDALEKDNSWGYSRGGSGGRRGGSRKSSIPAYLSRSSEIQNASALAKLMGGGKLSKAKQATYRKTTTKQNNVKRALARASSRNKKVTSRTRKA